MEAYKIVLAQNHALWSAHCHETVRLKYEALTWTRPVIPGSKLFVYKDLDVALEEVGIARSAETQEFYYQLWRVEADGLEQVKFAYVPYLPIENYLDYYKRNEEGYKSERFFSDFFWTNGVRLLEEIKR